MGKNFLCINGTNLKGSCYLKKKKKLWKRIRLDVCNTHFPLEGIRVRGSCKHYGIERERKGEDALEIFVKGRKETELQITCKAEIFWKGVWIKKCWRIKFYSPSLSLTLSTSVASAQCLLPLLNSSPPSCYAKSFLSWTAAHSTFQPVPSCTEQLVTDASISS